jgi:hypothetical protein
VRSPLFDDMATAEAAARTAQATARDAGFDEPVPYIVRPVGEGR